MRRRTHFGPNDALAKLKAPGSFLPRALLERVDRDQKLRWARSWSGENVGGLQRATRKTTNDPMEATFIGFRMWAQAVAQAGTANVDAVRQPCTVRESRHRAASRL